MDRNEGYRRFTEELARRGYRSTWQLGLIAYGMTVDCYLGGRLSPLLVQRHWQADRMELIGWDAYAPLTTSNQVDDTIKALEEQPADLTVLPTETVERVVDSLNALLGVIDRLNSGESVDEDHERIEIGRSALREIATEIGKNR